MPWRETQVGESGPLKREGEPELSEGVEPKYLYDGSDLDSPERYSC